MNNSKIEELCGIKLEISDGDIETAIQSMTGYLFYKNIPGGRHFECSRCRCDFDILSDRRMKLGIENNALIAAHNEEGVCPKCNGTVIFKQDGKTKNGSLIRDEKCFAVPYVISENQCCIFCFSVYKGYKRGCRTNAEIWIDTIYSLKPGGAVKYRHLCNNHWYGDTYSSSKSVAPFGSGCGIFNSHYPYKFMEIDRLNGCFLRWSAWEKWRGALCEYLYAYCTHMQFEFLMKSGLCQIVNSVVYEHKEMKLQFDWSAKGPGFFKTMTRDDVRSFKENGCDIEALKFRDRFRRICNLSLNEAGQCCHSAYMTEKIKKYLIKYRKDPRKYIKYISNQNYKNTDTCCHAVIYIQRSAFNDYLDYLDMCNRCDVDLSDDAVFYPKDIMAAHDRMLEIQNALAREKRILENAEKELDAEKLLEKRRRKYEWSSDGYIVTVPATLSAIVAEGQAQKNCVAGYTDLHAKGKLTILFIRYSSAPDQSLITVEMSNDGEIRQARAVRNTSPDKAALAFIEKYKKHLEYEKMKGKRKNGKDSSKDTA